MGRVARSIALDLGSRKLILHVGSNPTPLTLELWRRWFARWSEKPEVSGSTPRGSTKIKEMEQINHWRIKGICYWEAELSKDEDGNVWVNVGYCCPLVVKSGCSLVKVLAVSGCTYAQWFS